MKLGKKPKVILIGGLIAALGIFTSSAYGINDRINIKTRNPKPVVLNNIFREELANYKTGKKLKENTIYKKDVVVALTTSETIKQSNVPLSRGGSGLNTQKQQSKAQTKPSGKSYNSASASNGTSSADKVNEVDLFARLVSAEAGGESFEGQLAVASVIMNRVQSPEFPNSITGVIMDKNWGYQFSPVLDGRINLPASTDAKKAVAMVLGGYRSFGADVTYFINPKKAVSTWIINHKTFFKTIGNHDFYL